MTEIEFRGFAGLTLRAEGAGSPEDPAVLLIHGAGQTRKMWNEVAAELVTAGRYVIALDLRGHGASERPGDGRYDIDAFVEDVRAVLEQMASRPTVVAASLGGWIAALALADRGRHLASALVLADAPPQLVPDAAARIGEKLRARAMQDGVSLDWDLRVLDGLNAEDAVQRVKAVGSQLTLPVLFVRGALSEITEARSAAQFVGQMPDAEYAEIEGVGHLAPEERSEQFNSVLVAFLERRAPRTALEYRAGSDARTLRDAMGCFATGVTVVTAMGEDGTPTGLTASSFTSVSLDPPLLLICIDAKSGSLQALERARHFAINVLHIGQQPVSTRFAKRGEDKFASTAWEVGETGAPVLRHVLAAYECERFDLHRAGDHTILIGRVVSARFEPRRDPLLYFRGKYRRLHFN